MSDVLKLPDLISYTEIDGHSFRYDCYLSDNFTAVKNISHAYGLIHHNREILLVSGDGEIWEVPGGSINTNEAPTEGFSRELREETNASFKPDFLEPFFYQVVFENIDGQWEFISSRVLYIAPLENKSGFTDDPENRIVTNKFVAVNQLHEHLQWGELSEWIEMELTLRMDGFRERITSPANL